MKSKEILNELRKRNHNYLYHACTATTFQSYCFIQAYKSRETIEKAGLSLTPQYSDFRDKELGVYNSLFLNIYDIHDDDSFRTINSYGPILMVFDIEVVNDIQDEIKSYRKEISDLDYVPNEHKIVTLNDFIQETFRYTCDYAWSDDPSRRPGTRGPLSAFYFEEENNGIPLGSFLTEIIVDRLPDKHRKLQEKVIHDLELALSSNGLGNIPIHIRECKNFCDCNRRYSLMNDETLWNFFYMTNQKIFNFIECNN